MTRSRKHVSRLTSGAAAIAVSALVLSACGGGSGGSSKSDDKPVTFTSHDDIVKKAEATDGGKVDILLSLDNLDAVAAGFEKAYPKLKAHIVEFTGTDVYQRFALEAEADAVSDDWDVAYAPPENYAEFQKLMANYDFVKLSADGVLDIPEKMIDQDAKKVVSASSQIGAIGYNKDLISEDELPKTWEDLLDPKWKGKFVLDVRPSNMAPMVAVWGEDKTYAFAKKLAAQDPVWVRGNTDALTRIQAGENELMVFANYHSGIRAMEKDPKSALRMKLIDPIPVRVGESLGIFNSDIANNPAGAALFIEWMSSPAAQAILDQDPLKSSIYSDTGRIGQIVKEHETATADFDRFAEMEGYMGKIVEAFGFPQPAGG
jgi:iron(III) transport system substrate-binding protein